MTILGLDDPSDLPPSAQKLLGQAAVVAGPKRLIEATKEMLDPACRTLPLSGSFAKWLEELKDAPAPLLVLSDGDPNYFGLAAKLKSSFPDTIFKIVPAVTTVQKAFALMQTTWAGAEVQSLHGRTDWRPFWAALFRSARKGGSGEMAVYTDEVNNPSVIARKMLERGQDHFRLIVFQDLGPNQEIWSGSPAEAAERSFSSLNLTVIERTRLPAPLTLGAPESAYERSQGLITKSEVRVCALALLELTGSETMWDIGCGSGSVSLEASALLHHGQVQAVEKDPKRADQAKANRSRFGAAHVEIHEGDALAVMPKLDDPDRVFVGGAGNSLEAVLETVRLRLKPNGVIVLAVVKLDSLNKAVALLNRQGFRTSVSQICASRSEPLAESLYLKPINPVFLVKAKLSSEEA
jgi:precorrin-6Y C5,15-methyltransferase (decarboxylating)